MKTIFLVLIFLAIGGVLVVASQFIIAAQILNQQPTGALGVCLQLDKYPLTKPERANLHQYILEQYGVRCP